MPRLHPDIGAPWSVLSRAGASCRQVVFDQRAHGWSLQRLSAMQRRRAAHARRLTDRRQEGLRRGVRHGFAWLGWWKDGSPRCLRLSVHQRRRLRPIRWRVAALRVRPSVSSGCGTSAVMRSRLDQPSGPATRSDRARGQVAAGGRSASLHGVSCTPTGPASNPERPAFAMQTRCAFRVWGACRCGANVGARQLLVRPSHRVDYSGAS